METEAIHKSYAKEKSNLKGKVSFVCATNAEVIYRREKLPIWRVCSLLYRNSIQRAYTKKERLPI